MLLIRAFNICRASVRNFSPVKCLWRETSLLALSHLRHGLARCGIIPSGSVLLSANYLQYFKNKRNNNAAR
ncbi:hypothetical protein VFPPC_17017 [Pochonia chlamydosporia 170]|uniref:Uncharacterized protein n=1 Tax=Pochonia chlamydosporia 170 TaxID=1380566 RepID=A0A179EYH5_METCM|nr:hypothetical protein VFPPC_17017 [Pochonia chlamydosporia 170]OAQ58231.1 hypothetical protein VFPPC_17017 [Pochonia chlamydosporia 170]